MFQKILAPSEPKIGHFGRFLPKILVFLDLKVTTSLASHSPYWSPDLKVYKPEEVSFLSFFQHSVIEDLEKKKIEIY